jgi:hypothetical protein
LWAALRAWEVAVSEAEVVVQGQVNAFNARDAERFAECYADDARVLAPDGNVMAAGKAEVGEFVIDEEQASGMVFEGMPDQMHAAVVYHVAGGRIRQSQLFM